MRPGFKWIIPSTEETPLNVSQDQCQESNYLDLERSFSLLQSFCFLSFLLCILLSLVLPDKCVLLAIQGQSYEKNNYFQMHFRLLHLVQIRSWAVLKKHFSTTP